MPYCNNPLKRSRLITHEVTIGNLQMGGNNPIRVQSMTTTDTLDTNASVEQSIRMIEAGCELVRLTAPSKKEAENLGVIREKLAVKGYDTPLVADIHFTPNAAEIAAKLVQKVRVNPGNYADKKKFEEIEYTNESYQEELLRIEQKFSPLVNICQENNTAMRIGTNHGSLSDRILSRYGDTPEGMVESAYEFIEICEKHNYYNLVISMKASNTLVMIHAYRLLVQRMFERGRFYPLHLGVTEAGDGEDGRVKSAVGIGALLEDGIGDTVRVSLTEEPEAEIPVAQHLLEKYNNLLPEAQIDETLKPVYNPFAYERRKTKAINHLGGSFHPVVISDLSHKTDEIKPANFFGFGYSYAKDLDKWTIHDQAADFVYIGSQQLSFELPGTLGVITDYATFNLNQRNKSNYYPLFQVSEIEQIETLPESTHFICINSLKELRQVQHVINDYTTLIIYGQYSNNTAYFRNVHSFLHENELHNPVILKIQARQDNEEQFQLWTSVDLGIQLIDGFGDGIWIESNQPLRTINSTAFAILQATRTRISKTEYISCPSCGRTLFDLQETTAKIRSKTEHLKGVKIGIMGCIVNGPGEMADADYGYVGTGPGKINLYKEKTVVKRNIPESEAVEALIDLIKEHGDWIDKK
jgi:(E)-4-hydroxy-3-methylbut-2-enyl-diphosphate synthase